MHITQETLWKSSKLLKMQKIASSLYWMGEKQMIYPMQKGDSNVIFSKSLKYE